MAKQSTREQVRAILLTNPAVSGAAIARMLGITRQRVSQIAKAEGLTLRPDSDALSDTFSSRSGPPRKVGEATRPGRMLAVMDQQKAAERLAVVYALVDERTPAVVRFIGSTFDAQSRLHAHWMSGTGRLRAWMAEVVSSGSAIQLRQVGEPHVDRAAAYLEEEAQIAAYQAIGQADLNTARSREE